MSEKTKGEWNDEEWEYACVKELKARKEASSTLGVLSDEVLFREFSHYGILRGVEIGDEDTDKLLSLANFFSRLRELLGEQEGPYICYSDVYLDRLKRARAKQPLASTQETH